MRIPLAVSLCLWLFSGVVLAECPSADLTGDCAVDFYDLASVSEQWLSSDPCTPDDMVYIPDGYFEMGSHFEQYSNELPVHNVSVDYFYLSKYEITKQQYCDFLNQQYDACDIKVEEGVVYGISDSNNSYPYFFTSSAYMLSFIDFSDGNFSVRDKGDRSMANDPIACVSWYGAVAYCNWRGEQEGYQKLYDPCDPNWPCDFSKYGYRLPTEAEWEYAARGGEHSPYHRFPWGDTISHSQANYYADPNRYSYDVNPESGYHPDWEEGGNCYTAIVGSFPATGYGLYDMSGNVMEWCNDRYDSGYYSQSPNDNPTGPVSSSTRVARGGSWVTLARYCRVSQRGGATPSDYSYARGFRMVLKKDCPSLPADLSGDCWVDFEDFAGMANQWLDQGVPSDPCNMVWVDINDPGVGGHQGFNG